MTTIYGQKPITDLPEWYPCATPLTANAAGGSVAWDQRGGAHRHPWIYHYASAAILNAYNPYTDEWLNLASPAMGTFGAGAGCVFVPSSGPSGTLASGTNSTTFTLSTPLPAAVVANQLANRGDGSGYFIRVLGKTSGIVAEAQITSNTAGTTPVITVATALGFTPAASDGYEILSGRVFLFATAASVMKYYDVATNSYSAALTVTNLTTPATDMAIWVLDEAYNPLGKAPGLGFFNVCTATAATNVTNATLTGTTSGVDASLQANEYANFQIRITGDLTNPGSVGQRKKITSHTAANPTVYTLSGTWATAPSATATYVVEGIGDIVCCTGAVTLVHTYAASGFRADGAWSTGVTNGGVAALQIPARPAATAAGITGMWAYSMTALDAQKNARYSACYLLRGGAVATMDALDIATLSWSTGVGVTALAYGNSGLTTFTTGTSSAYDANSNSGQYWYINQSALQRFLRFDVLNRILIPATFYRQPQGAAVVGERMAVAWSQDGSTFGGYVYFWGSSQSNWTRILTQGYQS